MKDKIIEKIVDKVFTKFLNESQGVVENNMVEFAEYLWTRCTNNKIKPNRYGEINFTIPSKLWNKFNTYKLNSDKVRVCISNRMYNAEASFSLRGEPTINIADDLIYAGHDEFIETLMHELTHFINQCANNAKTTSRNTKTIGRSGAYSDSSAGQLEYFYDRTEMNARLTQAYYYLKHQYQYQTKVRYIVEKNKDNQQYVLNTLFDIIMPITKYSEMESYMGKISRELRNPRGYNNYVNNLKDDNRVLRDNDHTDSLTSFMRYGKNLPNKNHTAEQYFTRKYKIYFFMEKELDNFKTRIYKMIYKFMTETE